MPARAEEVGRDLYHQQRRARERLRVRARREREQTIQFLCSGGELNPGPHGPAGRQARSAPPKVEGKSPKLKILRPDAVNVLHAAVSAELTQQAGERDAQLAIAEAQELAERLKSLEAAVSAELTAQEEATAKLFDNFSFKDFYFNPITDEPSFPVYVASKTRDGLFEIPWPHRVAHVTFQGIRNTARPGVVDAKKVQISQVNESPGSLQRARAPGNYHVVRFQVDIQSYGALMAPGEFPSTSFVEFSWEQWCDCHCSRSFSTDLWATLKAVRAYRAQHRGYPQGDLDMSNASLLCDNVFAALMVLEREEISQDRALLTELGAKVFTSTAYNALNAAGYGEPSAGGFYVKGYTPRIQDLWPDAWNTCVQDVRQGLPTREAITRLIDQIAAAGVDIKARLNHKAELTRDRGFAYARRLPGMIKDVLPSFPDPTTPLNQLIGILKRLTPPVLPCDATAIELETGAASYLAARMEEVRVDDEDDAEVLKTCSSATQGRGWTTTQIQAFMAGAEDLLDVVKQGAAAVGQYFRQLRESRAELRKGISSLGTFVKAEGYGLDAAKAVRFISAPVHYVRGLTCAMLCAGQERFFHFFSEHCNKHRTPGDVLAEMAATSAMSEGPAIGVFESDFSSFESQINPRRRMGLESVVMEASVSRQMAAAVRCYNELMSDAMEFTSEFFHVRLPSSIRCSGEQGTSWGNFINNFSISFGAIARRMGETTREGARSLIERWSLPWRCEGDDGIFHLPIEVANGIQTMYRLAGAKVESAVHRCFTEVGYCGNRVQEVGGAFPSLVRVIDPLEKLAMLTISLNCDAQSNHGDRLLLAAKARSYLTEFPHTPILSPYCYQLLKRLKNEDAKVCEMTRALVAGEKVTGDVAKFLRQRVIARKGERDASVWAAMMTIDRDADFHRSEIPPEMRAVVHAKYPCLSPQVQKSIEDDLYSHALSGDLDSPVDIPALSVAMATCMGSSRMTERWFQDRRDQAKEVLASAAEKTVVAGTKVKEVLTGGWASLFTTICSLLVFLCATATGVAVWIGAISWLAIMVAPLVALVATAVLYFALIVLLGLSLATARRVVAACWWTVLLLYVTGVCVKIARARAAVQSPSDPSSPATGVKEKFTKLKAAWNLAAALLR